MTITTQTRLLDLFEDHYHPEKMDGAKFSTLAIFPRSIKALRKLLQRKPVVGDLTIENIKRVQSLLRDKGVSSGSTNRIGRTLGDLWRYAHELGIMPPCPVVENVTGGSQKTLPASPKATIDNAPAGTFEAAYRDNVRPTIAKDVGALRLRELDLAVRRFTLFRGDYTPTEQLSEHVAEAFDSWLADELGIAGRSLSKHSSNIRHVMRCIDANAVKGKWMGRSGNPKARGRKPAFKFSENPEPGSVRHFFAMVYKPRRLLGKSPETSRLYRNTFSTFAHFLGREPMLTDLVDDTLAAFLASILDSGLSRETATKCGHQLMALGRYAYKRRFIDIEPELQMPRLPTRVPQAWLKPELAAIFQAVGKLKGRVGKFRASEWWTGLLLLCFYSSERISALLQLRWQHVNLETRWVIVPAEFRKGRRADKAHPLAPVVVNALAKLQGADDGLVFPWPSDRSTIYYHLKKILKTAGLPTDRRSKFHRIRRSAASWFAAAGGDPSQLLDHADPRVTARYLDPRIVTTKSAAELLDDPTEMAVPQ